MLAILAMLGTSLSGRVMLEGKKPANSFSCACTEEVIHHSSGCGRYGQEPGGVGSSGETRFSRAVYSALVRGRLPIALIIAGFGPISSSSSSNSKGVGRPL